MNKNLLVLCSVVFALSSGKAQTVSVDEAMSAAQNFLGDRQKAAMYCAKVAQQGNDTLLYVFNADKAFVMVSATKKTMPVLAYSKEGIYEEQDIIPPAAMWLNHYQQQIAAAKAQEVNNALAAKSWQQLLEGGKKQKGNTDEVAPFLRSKWGQGKYYNYYCPKDDSSSYNGRAVTGCVATALAQLMYYFRFPDSGVGSYSYQHAKYGTLSADFAAAHYNYTEMCGVPTAPNAAISLLMNHCGIAVDMAYGYNSSGMYNHSAARALRNYFKFSPQTKYAFRDSTTMNWDSLIVAHLEKKIPLYYAGWSEPPTVGHAFICDGYQKDEQDNYFYHFDFGWDGSANGYFYTDKLNVGGSSFNLAQELIINAYPDTLKYTYPLPYSLSGSDTLTNDAGSFTDGSGIFNQNTANRDFTWVILPDADNLQSIQFSIHYQLNTQDTLFIETNEPASYIFTDTAASFAKNIKGKKIVVRLKTQSGEENSGIFHASYASVYPNYCSYEVKTQASNTLSDGSGNYKYNNMTICEKRIVPIGDYTAVTVHFTKFETEENKDFLYIYDFGKNQKTLLLTLSGTHTGESYTFDTRTLSLIFETNERNPFDGWELSYTAGYVGVNELQSEKETKLRVFPNPAKNQLTISLPNPSEGGAYAAEVVEIYSIVGQKLYPPFNSPEGGKYSPPSEGLEEATIVLDIFHLPAGMYFLKVGNKTARFVKE